MQRAIFLANKGQFNVAPNPRVGAVVVYNNRIIGEGYHAKYGEAHAEVNAINSVEDKDLLSKSTIYITLEPCSHQGKTPPCVDLILKYKIPRVVISNRDPFEKVNGSGIEKLKANGVEIILDNLVHEGRELNRRFFTFYENKRPYIILKWAETADGYISRNPADISGTNNWISNSISKQLVHQWRAEEQAILVGKQTAFTDNPSLTCREVAGRNPIRIAIDPNLELDSELNLFNSDADTIILNQLKSEKKGKVEFIQIEEGKDFFQSFNQICFDRGIQSVLIEGGKFTLEQWVKNKNWDEARVFKSKTVFKQGIKAPLFNEKALKISQVETDILSIYRSSDS